MSDTVTAVQPETGPGSPMTDKPGAGESTDAKGIPRRSSIIKVNVGGIKYYFSLSPFCFRSFLPVSSPSPGRLFFSQSLSLDHTDWQDLDR